MIRTRLILSALIACLGGAWQPSIARAADENVQLWVIGSARTDLGGGTRAMLDGSIRFREDARRGEEKTIRLTLERKVARGVTIGGGGGIWESAGGFTEIRPHQQVTVLRGGLSARTRLEERIFDDAPRMAVRFRQRLRYAHALSDRTKASVEGEWLHLVRTRDRTGPQDRDQWRARISLQHSPVERLTLGLAWLAIHDPSSQGRARYAHVPQLRVDWRF
ncbi:DUF2490 domain-containing protein [Erythrobacter sp. HL-111]|uniref:DUF2490 domain-containing protein n=1 Tax=Erythrobacter sp. HL-111 TaxID=1798193 RepID=UPI0006DA034D|nr:DUF2490 domain-containing protein [Erythrobacter sp. HL-111]KPP85251.1 MAG: Protein of unknown function (DUF2490) [Erythrobacteraceae bacterium HL-111]SDS22748.1 Protein of unknown function [Erythrobacter sp. HL-111]